jgi:molybdopterin converting factor small subunit
MKIKVFFYSYFKELTGCASIEETISEHATVGGLLTNLYARFPKLSSMANSTLIAVGVEYQNRGYVLHDGDEVSLFPPVQGG